MKRTAAIAMALLAIVVGACATTPTKNSESSGGGGNSGGGGFSGGAAPTRPLADAAAASPADAKALVHVQLGMAYVSVARYEVALDEAKAALAESANYAPAYHLTGVVYMFLGDMGRARENLETALRAAPGDPDFNNSYGWFLCQQGQMDEGLGYLARAARNPHYRYQTRPYTNAGMCLLQQNNFPAAEAQFTSAVDADPTNSQALYQLALIAYQRGDYVVAHERLVRMHRGVGPSAASAWLGVRTERRLGNRDAEASYAAQLRSRFSESPEYQQMQQGRYE